MKQNNKTDKRSNFDIKGKKKKVVFREDSNKVQSIVKSLQIKQLEREKTLHGKKKVKKKKEERKIEGKRTRRKVGENGEGSGGEVGGVERERKRWRQCWGFGEVAAIVSRIV